MSPKVSAFVVLATAILAVSAKPSHPYGGFHQSALPEHFDFSPPVLPPAEFHTAHSPHLIPEASESIWTAPEASLWATPEASLWATPEAPLWPAQPAPFLPHPAVLPAPEPLWPAPAAHHFIQAPAHFLPAPSPLLPAPLPLTKVLPPLYEAVAFAPPTYRATFGPKTTTHHVSVGYAFPQPTYAKIIAPHAHLHAAPLTLSHHHHLKHLKSLW